MIAAHHTRNLIASVHNRCGRMGGVGTMDFAPKLRASALGAAAAIAIAGMGIPGEAGAITCNGVCYGLDASSNVDGFSVIDSSRGEETSVSVVQNYSTSGRYMNGAASADLATGALRGFIDTDYGGSVSARLSDQFVFDLPDGMESADIAVSWTFEGTNIFRDPSAATYTRVAAGFSITGFGGTDSVQFNNLNYQFTGADWQELNTEGFHRFTYNDVLTVRNGQLFRLDASIALSTYGSATLDYANTSFFTFILPDGVGLTSGSGVLLSRAAGGVPEPSTWAMLLFGFGAIGAILRQGRQRSLPV
ncbi:PEPxxWA-CTERM sorting domain-containing protein [Phenylobacterium sp.]|uniref:PEPxxWA-CTERM sorting domain-containing protein n=1 Tax=Phenylobacterium sp. TaxID=1871053 RepID=UPI0025FB44AC|nr:PEPxxWA-CTERM sorting domain-containing protein [Phenylobacterium sp.]